jgi:hypothetical protein
MFQKRLISSIFSFENSVNISSSPNSSPESLCVERKKRIFGYPI